MIQTTITGNIGRDAKIVEQQNGNAFCAFTVAVDDSYTNKENTKVERTIWVECIINDTKKGIIPFLKKGSKILVQGKPVAGVYADKDGKPQAKLTLNVTYSELTGRAPETASAPVTGAPAQTTAPAPEANIQPNDDLPF